MSDNLLASWQSAQFIETAALINAQNAWSGLPFNSSSFKSFSHYCFMESSWL